MTEQQQFDRLRVAFAAALNRLIAEARKTELQIRTLQVPASLDAARHFNSQRRAEVDAHEVYIAASSQLATFVRCHLYIVN